jgi:hypothetical protein
LNFEKFFADIEGSDIQIPVNDKLTRPRLLSNEALFQIPLISLVLLVMAKDRRKPRVAELGQLVGETIEASVYGFKGSAQLVGWSANLRMRTVKALNFLELAGLVVVDNRKGKINVTDLGKRTVEKALSRDDELSQTLIEIRRSYRHIKVEKQMKLTLR